jgi:ribosomal-protein-serine acetyltransferase
MEPGVAANRRVIAVASGMELRELVPAEADELYPVIDRNRDRLRACLPWMTPGYSIADMRSFLEMIARQHREGLSWTATIRQSGALCGAIAFHLFDRPNRCGSIGYWLDAAYSGRGIMTEACRALVSEGFSRFHLHRIEIRCAVGNERSCGIPQRLGFREEGLLREREWLHDRWVDLRVFAMLEQDWK